MNHRQRELAAPKITRDAAWEGIPPDLTVKTEGTALIPTPGKNEVLCHEFVCTSADGANIIVYINAETGKQQDILLLIESENGVLTV